MVYPLQRFVERIEISRTNQNRKTQRPPRSVAAPLFVSPRLYASRVCAGVWTVEHPDTYIHHIQRGWGSRAQGNSLAQQLWVSTPRGLSMLPGWTTQRRDRGNRC